MTTTALELAETARPLLQEQLRLDREVPRYVDLAAPTSGTDSRAAACGVVVGEANPFRIKHAAKTSCWTPTGTLSAICGPDSNRSLGR